MIRAGDVVSSGDVFSLGGRIGGTAKLEKAFQGYALVVDLVRYSKKFNQARVFKNCKLLMPDGSMRYASENHLNCVIGIQNEES